jgi:N-formylglutamate amidohydrolase
MIRQHPGRGVIIAAALIAAGLAPGACPRASQAEPPPPAVATAPTPATGVPFCEPDELISVQRGTLPIVLSAPHGGGVRIPGAKPRVADGTYANVTVRDGNTDRLVWLVAQRLTETLGGKPYVVVAQFSRKDADANRPPEQAFGNDAAGRHYDAYHRALRACVDEIRARHGNTGLLIDLHGQARVPGAIVRGTRTGLTLQALLEREGRAALVGPDSITGRLRSMGYQILPEDPAQPGDPAQPAAATEAKPAPADGPSAGEPADPPPARNADDARRAERWALGRETFLNGGHIVAHYGSHNPTGIDAIQLEIGNQRDDAKLAKTGRDIADAITAFAKRYLPVPPIEAQPPEPAANKPRPAPKAPSATMPERTPAGAGGR